VSTPAGTSDQIDKALVLRVQQGDKDAFDHLVRKYQHKIILLVNRYVKDPGEAQDIAQESFIKAYRALANFRGDSAFYTWLYRIAINTAKKLSCFASSAFYGIYSGCSGSRAGGKCPAVTRHGYA